MKKIEEKSILQKIQVVNKYKHDATSDDIYIGRGSVFGNPYSHLLPNNDPNKSDSREEAIEAYKIYFEDIINSCGCKHKDFKNKLREIIVRLKLGGKVNLVCFCKPKQCHGDIIRDYVLSQI